MKSGPQAFEEFTLGGVTLGPHRHGGYIFFLDGSAPLNKEEKELLALSRQHEAIGHNVRVVKPGSPRWEKP
eukprot:1305798-Alexandrium_andersonii.AAC.1